MEISLKKINVLLIVIAVVLFALIAFTFAYFVGGVGTPAITDTSITGEKESRLQFTSGTPISLVSSLDNFAEGAGSITGETISTAKLTSSSTEDVVSDEYYVYYNITENNYVYTVDESTPELILEVFDNEGNEITSLDGLTYVTTIDALTGDTINGFDVTTFSGLIKIKENMPISSTHPNDTEHEWKIKLTYINLDFNQSLNEGKEFAGNLVLSAYDMIFSNTIFRDNGGIESIESLSNKNMKFTEDDYGTTYYFLDYPGNNWVKFAGFYWQIIRINGDESVRLIYAGINPPLESNHLIKYDVNDLIIGDSESDLYSNYTNFNNDLSLAEYGGYMYTVGEQHGLTIDSTIKTIIDIWYENNIIEYENYLADVVFCGDRSAYTDEYGTAPSSGVGTGPQYFGYITRAINFEPEENNLVCQNRLDAYTVYDTVKGNGALKYPIAMMNADEYMFMTELIYGWIRGMTANSSQVNTLLMSPSIFNVFNENLSLNFSGVMHATTFLAVPNHLYSASFAKGLGSSYVGGIRPVINIKNNHLVSGSGTWNDPYVLI